MDYNFDTKSIKQLDRYQGILSEDDLLPIYLNREENYLSDDDNDPITLNSTKATTFGNIMQYFTPSVPQAEIQIQYLNDGEAIGSLRTSGATEENENYHLGQYAFAEGESTKAKGYAAHAEGVGSSANGFSSHAEGNSIASGTMSHSESNGTSAIGNYSHAEGDQTTANGRGSHSEGGSTISTGENSHAEGQSSESKGRASHAEGYDTITYEDYCHAQNLGTIASSIAQTTIGKYNIEDFDGQYSFIIGNGLADNDRSNALTVDWEGNITLQGNAYISDSSIENNKLVTKTELNSATNSSFNEINNLSTTVSYKANKNQVGFSPERNLLNTSFLDLVYPIGSIYMSMNNTNPEDLFGGTWESLAPGRVLLGAGTNENINYSLGATGGNKDAIVPYHNHTASSGGWSGKTESAGSHNHSLKGYSAVYPVNGKTGWRYGSGGGNNDAKVINYAGAHYHSIPNHNHTITVNYTGTSGNVVNANMPPYLVVNMWQRVADN